MESQLILDKKKTKISGIDTFYCISKAEEVKKVPEVYKLSNCLINSGLYKCTAIIEGTYNGKEFVEEEKDINPELAIENAIRKIAGTGLEFKLDLKISDGIISNIYKAYVEASYAGETFNGIGKHRNVNNAIAIAYIDSLNRVEAHRIASENIVHLPTQEISDIIDQQEPIVAAGGRYL